MWSRLKILHHTRVLDLTQEVFTDNDIIVFKFPQFLLLFFSAIEFCIPFSRKCLPVLTLVYPEDCIEKLGCPLFLSFSSLLFSSLPLLIINSERISFWRFGCHKQLLFVATFPASLAGHFEETRNRCALLSKFAFMLGTRSQQACLNSVPVPEEISLQCQVPPFIGKTTFALEPLLGRFFDTAHCLLDETIRLRMVAACSHRAAIQRALHDFTNAFEPSV